MFLRKLSSINIEQKEFDTNIFEQEKAWISKRLNGELVSSTTKIGLYNYILLSLAVGFFIGGSIGALFGAFLSNIAILYWTPIIVFLITFKLLDKKYAVVDFDLAGRMMHYEGLIRYAGDDQKIRYRGPIEVINGTQLIKHKRFNRYYLRFITNSGYMLINYNPQKEKAFLEVIELLGLIDLSEANSRISNQALISISDGWRIINEEKFDRTEYIKKYKVTKEQEAIDLEKAQTKKREELIERSKKRKQSKKKD